MVPVQVMLVMCSGINVIIDGVFASNFIGTDAMAVIGLYSPLTLAISTISALLYGGAQILCGKYLGENTLKRAKSTFNIDIVAALCCGLVITVIFAFFSGIAAGICCRSDNPLNDELIKYLKGMSSGVIPTILGAQLTSFLQLEKKEKLGYIGIGGMFVVNTAGDYIFIKILKLGLFGLGLSTALSSWVPVVIATIYFMSRKSVFKLSFSDLHIRDLGEIAINGLPMAVMQLMLVFRSLCINALLMEFAGNDGLSSFSAIGTLGCIYWALPAGVSSAFVSLMSIYTGEEDRSAIEVLQNVYNKKAVLMVLGVSAVMAAFAYPFTNLFFHDPASEVYKMTFIGFAVYPFYAAPSTALSGIRDTWRCMGRKIAVNIVVLFDGFICVTGATFVLMKFIGMTGAWIAQIAGSFIVLLIQFILAWIMNGKIPKTKQDFCCYPKGFGVDEDDRLSLSIHNAEEVVNISVKVIGFCLQHGIDNATSNHAGLCVEELAGNIVKHGFNGKKNAVADISVTKSEKGLKIKFTDNGPLFNPNEIDAIFNPEDPVRNIGIRLVSKACKEMEYHSVLGLNILSILI
jgi:Na+-driven multidrug efflux pump/anti-sigma regulatory factor (Ser/Thr protein kinase)